MPKPVREAPAPVTFGPRRGSDASMAFVSARSLESAMRVGEALTHGYTAFQSHLGEFTSRRLRRDMEAMRAYAACRDGAEAARLHSEFMENMINDYFREWHGLLSIAANVAKGVVEPIEENAVASLEEARREDAA